MANTHPIFQRPVIHCGGCGNPLIYPHLRETNSEKIAGGIAVLGECNKCGVAVEVPAGMFSPYPHVQANKTEARPWPAPRAQLTDEQKKALGLPVT